MPYDNCYRKHIELAKIVFISIDHYSHSPLGLYMYNYIDKGIIGYGIIDISVKPCGVYTAIARYGERGKSS